MRSVDDNRSSSSTLSAAPSLSNSKISLGASSHCSQKSTSSQKSHVSAEKPLTREEVIAAYLEKAKWYTSVGLGKEPFDLEDMKKKLKFLLLNAFFFHRNNCNSFSLRFSLPNSFCCGSGDNCNHSRLRSRF